MISLLLAHLPLPSVKTIYLPLHQSVQHLVYLSTPSRRLAPPLAWSPNRWCTKRQLQSLIGHLHHAAKVVWPGRAFIRRMINLLHNFRRDDHPIRLSAEFKKDLRWWLQYLASWNGVCFWVSPPIDLEMASDASGSFGFGAVFRTHWLYGK